MCVGLESFSWIDDSTTGDFTLLSFLDVIRVHPLREISIRTHSDLGKDVWSELITLTGLRKISIWCMEGPPRVLQGWSESLGSTLTHLELGVSAYSYPCSERVPPTILVSVLSQLPELRDLRLKGAPAHAIPSILSKLVHLRSLDTEYPGLYASRAPNASDMIPPPNFPTLRKLTVRTSGMDRSGPQALWGWIRGIVPKPGLTTLDLHVFTIDFEHTGVPLAFILNLARIHGPTLRHFIIGEAQLMLGDIACLCTKFPNLETLVCSTPSLDIEAIMDSIAEAKNLQTLRLHVQWIPSGRKDARQFTLQHAQHLMRRGEGFKLREVTIGSTLYRGKWVLEEPTEEGQQGRVVFQVQIDVADAMWET
ncbi:hypothetical protein C0991_004708 [Blastosporella zonata]|nr:hypothetical protein C0991_004708 [Blastosporella zonata]